MEFFNSRGWNVFRYGIYAPFYDLVGRRFSGMRRKSLAALNAHQGERLLIVGGGTGLDLELLPEGLEVTLTDITPAMVERAGARAQRLGRQVNALVLDGRELSFPSESFDCAVLHLVLAVMPEPDRCLKEIFRLLIPGGRAVVMDKFLPDGKAPSLPRKAFNVLASMTFSDINRRLGDMLEGSGLKVISDESAGFAGAYRVILLEKPAR